MSRRVESDSREVIAPQPPRSHASLQQRMDLTFRDANLLQTALTHRSYLNEADEPGIADNERLEYLGDALVDFAAARFLFETQPEAREGQLTSLRAALVCEPALAGYARELGLGEHLRLGRGEEASGARDRNGILGDAFEAVIAAIYLDQGYEPVERLLLRFFRPELAEVLVQASTKDAKSLFQELVQHAWQTTPAYETVSSSGPDHDKSFEVCVRVGSDKWGVGAGRSKAEAAQRAAEVALERLWEERPDLKAGDAP
jgi:ribonuclease-3